MHSNHSNYYTLGLFLTRGSFCPVSSGSQTFWSRWHQLTAPNCTASAALKSGTSSSASSPPNERKIQSSAQENQAGSAFSSPQVSSSSSTLSLLFGKRSFSSGLVISGLSAAEGGNTTDTQSSSSVNIAVGPSHRSSSKATQVK